MHVMFCDVVGSTALSEQLDPEDLRDLLESFQLICMRVVSRFEGHIAQFMGDGVLIYFGYPNARDDDAPRAVSAGLELARAVSRGTVNGHRIRVRVGIHSGVVVVGEIGVAGRRAELAVGETPNVAARVQAQAAPDTVVISQATERLVRGFFKTEDLGARSLRGLSLPVRIFLVIGESGARNRLEAASASGLTPFVARTAELANLVGNWDATSVDGGRIVSVVGEPGVGKSRLVETFRTRLSGQTEVVELGCSEYLRNRAFHPLAAMVGEGFDPAPLTSPEDKDALVTTWAGRFGLTASDARLLLADLLSVPLDAAEAEPIADTPSRRRARTIDVLTDWLLGKDRASKKLIVLEDVQWADASTLKLLDTIAERLVSSHVMLLLTFRADFVAPPLVHEHGTVISLSPLARSDATQMAAAVAGKALPSELTSRLDEWTKGVPLYIEEFTKGLLESGVLQVREHSFELSGPLPTDLIPATLVGPLTARIDRLGSAKSTIQLAAVIGMEVRYDMLARVCELERRALDDAVDKLVASELLVETSNERGRVFHFRHALIRDAAYGSLLIADRQKLHRRVVQAMQGHFPEFAEGRPEIVAHHAARAGLPALAVDEWRRACGRALAQSANWEALAHIDEGMKEIERLPAGSDRYEKQLVFEIDRGAALMAAKGYAAPDVKSTYRRARELCEKLGDPSRLYPILWGLWANHFVAGELLPARDFGDQVFKLAQDSGDPALIVPACHALGYTLCYAAEFQRALELAEMGIGMIDLEVERRNVLLYQFSSAVALRHIASVSLWMLGFPDGARSEGREAIDLAIRLAHPPTMAYAQSALTWGAPFLLSDLSALEEAAHEATRLSGAKKLQFWPSLVGIFGAWPLVASGRPAAAFAQMSDNFERYRASGGGILRPSIRSLMAHACWKAGDPMGALEIVSAALADVALTGEHNYEPELHRVRGDVMASLGSTKDAEESFTRALDLARRQRAKSLELRAATSLATYLETHGRGTEGRELVKTLIESFGEGFDTPDLLAAKRFLT